MTTREELSTTLWAVAIMSFVFQLGWSVFFSAAIGLSLGILLWTKMSKWRDNYLQKEKQNER